MRGRKKVTSESMPNAPTADSSPDTSSIPLKLTKPIPRRLWPKHSERDAELIESHLTSWLEMAAQAREAAMVQIQVAPEIQAFQTNLTYWDNVCSGLRWVIHHVRNRQMHLAVKAVLAGTIEVK